MYVVMRFLLILKKTNVAISIYVFTHTIQTSKKTIKQIMDDPIDDAEMKTYIRQDAKILKYSALKNLKHIDELMPKATDFIVLLYETFPNEGHWVSVVKYPER
jgi:hypothetical protein